MPHKNPLSEYKEYVEQKDRLTAERDYEPKAIHTIPTRVDELEKAIEEMAATVEHAGMRLSYVLRPEDPTTPACGVNKVQRTSDLQEKIERLIDRASYVIASLQDLISRVDL